MQKSAAKNKIDALRQANLDLFQSAIILPPLAHKIENDAREHNFGRNELPQIEQLYQLFNDLNAKYFEGALPPAKIIYSKRMLIAGSYSINEKTIRIGVKYHRIFPNELEDTLKHEMIHILDSSHGRNFKSIARRIGASLRAQSHPNLRLPTKYSYICPICGKVYPRRKRLRMASCGVCSKGGRFDMACKLKLLKCDDLQGKRAAKNVR